MDILKKTFLFRLYATDKKIFAVVAIYIAGILYSILNCYTYLFAKRCEEFPFLLYGMYSLYEPPQQIYTTYSIIIDGKEVNYSRLKDSQRELILSPLLHAIPLMNPVSSADTENVKHLREWLFRYSVDMRGLEKNKMEVYKLTCRYNEEGLPEILKKESLYTYAIE